MQKSGHSVVLGLIFVILLLLGVVLWILDEYTREKRRSEGLRKEKEEVRALYERERAINEGSLRKDSLEDLTEKLRDVSLQVRMMEKMFPWSDRGPSDVNRYAVKKYGALIAKEGELKKIIKKKNGGWPVRE